MIHLHNGATTMTNNSNNSNKILDFTNSSNSKSTKIRVLEQLGFSRATISKILEIKYQFVRNVLEQPVKSNEQQTYLQQLINNLLDD